MIKSVSFHYLCWVLVNLSCHIKNVLIGIYKLTVSFPLTLSIVRVGYRFPVLDFYLVLHGLRCRKSTIMD